MTSLLKGLSEERVVLVKRSNSARFASLLGGIVRLVDGHGATLGVVLDRKILEELEEDFESSSPEFLASLEASRRSGRVSGVSVKARAGLA